jgi:hypothetical protein
VTKLSTMRVVVGEQREDVVTPVADVRLAHPELIDVLWRYSQPTNRQLRDAAQGIMTLAICRTERVNSQPRGVRKPT